MKKFLLAILTLFLYTGILQAQDSNRNDSAQIPKESRKSQREARKAAENAYNDMLYQQALQAVKDNDFVLEAKRVEFRRGYYKEVTPMTNFISVKGNSATIQLALSNVFSGVNGLGGITVDGKISNVKMGTDKKGDLHCSMMVQGAAVSASITFTLVKGSNKCSVTVNPVFNGNRITFIGDLYPTPESNIYKGRAL